jgi:redox-sensing transcriptional repressor
MNQQTHKVPVPTLERMARYLACLLDLDAGGVETISSADMEGYTNINAAQFRKDLSYFGEFGRPGIGYGVPELTRRIGRILKVDREQPVLLIGAGNLGSALAGYPSLSRAHFRIAAVFDNNPGKIGAKLWGVDIYAIDRIEEINTASIGARIAIIAVPAVAGQFVADKVVACGITVILNFAPVSLRVPNDITVRNVDFVQELAVLSYHLAG